MKNLTRIIRTAKTKPPPRIIVNSGSRKLTTFTYTKNVRNPIGNANKPKRATLKSDRCFFTATPPYFMEFPYFESLVI